MSAARNVHLINDLRRRADTRFYRSRVILFAHSLPYAEVIPPVGCQGFPLDAPDPACIVIVPTLMATIRTDKQRKLTAQQELFCRYYAQNEALFGHATFCYAESHGFDLDSLSNRCPVHQEKDPECGSACPLSEYRVAYSTCSSNGSRALRNAKIQDRITALLNEMLRDEVVDSQLAKLIIQDGEPATKIAAIREYNKLRQRIVDKVEHTGEITSKVVYLPERKDAGVATESQTTTGA